jgi:hypothetical protein
MVADMHFVHRSLTDRHDQRSNTLIVASSGRLGSVFLTLKVTINK